MPVKAAVSVAVIAKIPSLFILATAELRKGLGVGSLNILLLEDDETSTLATLLESELFQPNAKRNTEVLIIF